MRDLIGLEVSAGDWLPLDTKSANFDNIADAQILSPTLLDAYLNAASSVSRLALGDKNAALTQTTYKSSPFASQHPWDHVEGAPFGTRGGIVTNYVFPADGLYQFRMVIEGGVGTHLEDVDISIDGQRASLFHYEKGVNRTAASADAPLGADLYVSDPIPVKAGQQLVSAAFVRRTDGPYEDLVRPHDWSMASNGNASAGTTTPPHLMELTVIGPSKITGISDSKSRRLIFSCHPSKTLSEHACAEQIVDRLGTRAYRRPLTKHDRDGLMNFYTEGAKSGGFEEGIRSALQAILVQPVLRVPIRAGAGERARPARTIGSATSTSRRGCRSSSGAASRTTNCSKAAEQKKLSDAEDARHARCTACWPIRRPRRCRRGSPRSGCGCRTSRRSIRTRCSSRDFDHELADDMQSRDGAVLRQHRARRSQRPRLLQRPTTRTSTSGSPRTTTFRTSSATTSAA